MLEESTKLIEKFDKLKKTDFEKLQIHVIFDYMPIKSKDSSSFTPEFINEIVQKETNFFNFSFSEKPEHIFEKNITKIELETLLPELNETIKASELRAINEHTGGTRITKRQKKSPNKKNKHHTARKHT